MRVLLLITILGCLLARGVEAQTQTRVWVDTDPACGATLSTSDPDDCLAILMAMKLP